MDSPDLCKDCWNSLILTTAEKCHPQLVLGMTAPEIQSFAVKGSSPPLPLLNLCSIFCPLFGWLLFLRQLLCFNLCASLPWQRFFV